MACHNNGDPKRMSDIAVVQGNTVLGTLVWCHVFVLITGKNYESRSRRVKLRLRLID